MIIHSSEMVKNREACPSLKKEKYFFSGMLQSMGSQRVGHDWVTEQLRGLVEG